MSWMQPDTAEARSRNDAKRMKRLERRTHRPLNRGPVSRRDMLFAPPTNQAERVALAGTDWFDTDLGIDFRYYADDLDPVAPGLKAQSAGWFPADARQPFVLADKNLAQTIATTAATAITWTSAAPLYDPFGMYDPAQPTRLTAPWAGLWRIDAKVRYNNTMGASMVANRNGVAYGRTRTSAVGGTGAVTTLSMDAPIYMGAGQYIELIVGMAAATSVTVTNSETYIKFQYEGPAYS